MNNLKHFQNESDQRFVYENKELQFLIRNERGNEMKNANIEVDLSGGLTKIAEHNAALWQKFLKKFSEKAKMSKNDLIEVSMTTEENRAGKYTLLFKMGSRGHKILQLLGDNLEHGMENYVLDKSYELKPLKAKMAPPPPAEKPEPKVIPGDAPVAAEAPKPTQEEKA